MSRKNDKQPILGAPQSALHSAGKIGRTIELPQPTQDQETYLEEIKRSTGQYDPKIIVGGPRGAAN